MSTGLPSAQTPLRKRAQAAERREAIIVAAVHEFARGGLHGTPVERIARRVGIAQPYVFSLFGTKRDLFLAAVERAFSAVADTFTEAAAGLDRQASGGPDILDALGEAYEALLRSDRDLLMLQHQAYAACDDDVIRDQVRGWYARIVRHVEHLSLADPTRIDAFFHEGMWLNVAAAMGISDLSAGGSWMRMDVESSAGLGDMDEGRKPPASCTVLPTADR